LKLNQKNRNHHAEKKAEAVEREFVIDIDMSDYDSIRTCCEGKKLCNRCWKFMVAAYEVLKVALEDDYGFKNMLWVFSGRRGIHVWVCDDRARLMNNQIRGCVTSYLDLSVTNEKMDSLTKPIVWEQHRHFPHFK
jgi:DNA primase small subunit